MMIYETCPGIILTSIGEQEYLVTAKNRIQLNDTAAFYWKCLSEGADINKLKEAVRCEYDLEDSEELEQEIQGLIQELLEGQLIQEITK